MSGLSRVLVLLFASFEALAAQEPLQRGAEAPDPRLIAALATLQPGDRVMVVANQHRGAGRYEKVLSDSLFFRASGAPATAVRVGAIDSLWIGTSGAGRGATIGAIVGGVLVASQAMLIADGDGERDFPSDYVPVLYGGLIGATVGSFAGIVLGAPFRWWERKYP